MRGKPVGCFACPLLGVTNGYCADHVPSNPKIGLMFGSIPKAVALAETWTKWQELENDYLQKHKLSWKDVLITSELRCMPPTRKGKKLSALLGAANLRRGSNTCRCFDGRSADPQGALSPAHSVRAWKPDTFIISFDISQTYDAPAFKVFIWRAIELALLFAQKGLRPLVLLGEGPAALLNPGLFSGRDGHRVTGLKHWVGEWFCSKWPEAI